MASEASEAVDGIVAYSCICHVGWGEVVGTRLGLDDLTPWAWWAWTCGIWEPGHCTFPDQLGPSALVGLGSLCVCEHNLVAWQCSEEMQ